MHLAFGEVTMCGYMHSACMGEDVWAVCVTFIVAQLWWMESCIALLGPLVSQRAEADHLGMMHHARRLKARTDTHMCLCVYCVSLHATFVVLTAALTSGRHIFGNASDQVKGTFSEVATRAAGSSMLMVWWGFVSAPVNIKQAMSWFQLSQKPSFF